MRFVRYNDINTCLIRVRKSTGLNIVMIYVHVECYRIVFKPFSRAVFIVCRQIYIKFANVLIL